MSVLATGVACLSLAWACIGSAAAATLTVTTTVEGTAGDGSCSLREAVLAANANGASASDCGKGEGADVIQLGALRYTLSLSGTDDTGAAGDLDVTDDLTIIGVDAATTVIDGGEVDRVFDVKAVTVSLQRLTVTGGRAPDGAVGATVSASSPGTQAIGQPGLPGGGGGGIRNAGALSLTDCIVNLNQAGTGGGGGAGFGAAGSAGSNGIAGGYGRGGEGGAGGPGGGILITGGSLLLERTIVQDNVAGAGGLGGAGAGGNGGLATGATGTGGTGGSGFGEIGGGGGSGGGVAATGGTLQIIDSTIDGNHAGVGGAMGDGFGAFGGTAIGASGTGGLGGQGNFNQPTNAPGASGGAGGGVYATTGANAKISDSLIVGNASGAGGRGTDAEGGQGGGVTEPGRPAGTGGAGVAGNGGRGGYGGGIHWEHAGLVENSTISGNFTGQGGAGGNATGAKGGTTPGGTSNGGFAWAGDAGTAGWGAGVVLSYSSPTPALRHVTVAANNLGSAGAVGTAVGGAPGTNAASGTTGSTMAGTPAAPANIGGVYATSAVAANTIVSGNASSQCTGVADGAHNISFPDTSCPGANADPQLGPLADNGGPTRTHALLAGSPALGGVPAAGAGCTATDQRGITRPQDIACDIGAYEQAPPVVSTGGTTGVTTTGATLLGTITPNLQATTYRFEFGTSTAYGSLTSIGNVAAAGGPTYVSAAIPGLAPATTYHYRLVATNADGTSASTDATFTTAGASGAADGPGTGGGGGSGGGSGGGAGGTGGSDAGGDRTAPRWLAASLRPATFAVDPRGRRETRLSARARRGSRLSWGLSERADVQVTVSRVRPGRRAGTRCIAPGARNRTGRACTRLTVAGRFAISDAAERGSVSFSGRIGPRSLSPGRYQARLVAQDAAGNRSAPRVLSFRIVAR